MSLDLGADITGVCRNRTHEFGMTKDLYRYNHYCPECAPEHYHRIESQRSMWNKFMGNVLGIWNTDWYTKEDVKRIWGLK